MLAICVHSEFCGDPSSTILCKSADVVSPLTQQTQVINSVSFLSVLYFFSVSSGSKILITPPDFLDLVLAAQPIIHNEHQQVPTSADIEMKETASSSNLMEQEEQMLQYLSFSEISHADQQQSNCRKWQRNPLEWKHNNRKKLVNSGCEYVAVSGKIKEIKAFKGLCDSCCRTKCSLKKPDAEAAISCLPIISVLLTRCCLRWFILQLKSRKGIKGSNTS